MSPEKRESSWAARLQLSFSLPAKLAAILFSILLGESAFAQSSVTLAWNPSADATAVGYRLYQGGVSKSYTNNINVGNLTTRTVSGLVAGATYYFAAASYNASGVESDYSNEISYTVPGPAPAVTGCAKLSTGNFTLSSSGVPNQTCVLLAATNLTAPVVWTPIATNTANAQGLINFTDTKAGNYSRRYYRIQVN